MIRETDLKETPLILKDDINGFIFIPIFVLVVIFVVCLYTVVKSFITNDAHALQTGIMLLILATVMATFIVLSIRRFRDRNIPIIIAYPDKICFRKFRTKRGQMITIPYSYIDSYIFERNGSAMRVIILLKTGAKETIGYVWGHKGVMYMDYSEINEILEEMLHTYQASHPR